MSEDDVATTQLTLILNQAEARKLAIDLLTAAEKCNHKDHFIKMHSFGSSVGAWSVSDPVLLGPM